MTTVFVETHSLSENTVTSVSSRMNLTFASPSWSFAKTGRCRAAASAPLIDSRRSRYADGENSTADISSVLSADSTPPVAENVLRNEYPSESIFWLFGMSSGLPKDSPSSMRMPSAVRAVESITSGNRRWSSEVLPASMKFAMPSAPDRNGTFTLSRDSPRIAASGICAEIDTSSGLSVSRMSRGRISHLTSSAPGATDFRARSNMPRLSFGVLRTSAWR